MKIRDYTPEKICWVDLGTTDFEAARSFYAELFGWTFKERRAGEDTYALALKNGRRVAGLYEITGSGPRAAWTAYVCVDGVIDACRDAEELGGKALGTPKISGPARSAAVIQDPAGAVLGVRDDAEPLGTEVQNEPGTVCWAELSTPDPRPVESFYTSLFGWSAHRTIGAIGEPYVVFKTGPTSVAGLTQVENLRDTSSPHWDVYFGVESVDAYLNTHYQLGGELEIGPVKIVEAGRFAVVRDPQGGRFGVFEHQRVQAA